MALSNKQISRLLLGALRSANVGVTPDDVDELDIYVENGFQFLEEQHFYDPKQYATVSADIAVQYYAAWRYCSLRPNLVQLSVYYGQEFANARRVWAGKAAEEVNIDHNEYPENRRRVSWNEEDPLDQSFNVFGVDPNRLGN